MSSLDKFDTKMIVNNRNYETDLNYDLELIRLLMKIIGVWPTDSRQSTNFDRIVAVLVKSLTIFFLIFLMIPVGCHVFLVEKDWSAKIPVIATVNYCFEAIVKYAMLIARNEEIKYCIDMIASDWLEVDRAVCRSIMLENARLCRIFTKFLYTATIICMSIYHFVEPFVFYSSNQLRQNGTNLAPILYSTEFFFFDARLSPMSEIVYLAHILGAIAMCTVNCAICSLTVKFAMHAWSRYQIVIALLQSVDDAGNGDDNNVKCHDDKQRRFAHIVRRHLQAIEFVFRIENALNEMSFVCLAVSTVDICFIGYILILEFENTAPSGIATYAMAMMCASSNMFVLCYSGEQLAEKCREVGVASYMTNWWGMQRNESRALILIIAASQLSVEFTAGKFFTLSFKTFIAVMKIAMSYLNVLRTMINFHN